MELAVAHSQFAMATPAIGEEIKTYKVTLKHGTQSGLGVSVSGAGAWAKLKGTMKFNLKHLDSSKTYDLMKTKYNISGGVAAFWSWIGIRANADAHKEEIHEVFNEVSNSQDVAGKADLDLFVSGIYSNVQVDASAYVLILQIEDSQGNTVNTFSTGDPKSDTGAQDQNGNSLPQRDNKSSIDI